MTTGRSFEDPYVPIFIRTLAIGSVYASVGFYTENRCLSVLMYVDTGPDVDMAIALASNLPNVCIEAVTVAAENVNASAACDNTLGVLSILIKPDERKLFRTSQHRL